MCVLRSLDKEHAHHYAIQCTDQDSGAVGCFLLDPERSPYLGDPLYACSPVFEHSYLLFQWARDNGVRFTHQLRPKRPQ